MISTLIDAIWLKESNEDSAIQRGWCVSMGILMENGRECLGEG